VDAEREFLVLNTVQDIESSFKICLTGDMTTVTRGAHRLNATRRSPRSGPRPDRRQMVLDAAIKLFSERPFNEITVAEVAREAGVAQGLPAYYFGDKRGLYLEALRHLVDLLIASGSARSDEGDVDKSLRGLVDGQFEFLAGHRNAYVTLMSSGMLGLPGAKTIYEDLRNDLVRRVARIVTGSKAIPPPALRAAIKGWTGLLAELALDWLRHDDLERLQVVELAIGALRGALVEVSVLEPALAESFRRTGIGLGGPAEAG
jgi:AcrR family transcriptional regulator